MVQFIFIYIIMTLSEYDMHVTSSDEVENRTIVGTKFPVVQDDRIKTCCSAALDLKMSLNYIKHDLFGVKERQTQIKSQDE